MLWFNIFWILYAVLWAAVVRYDVHMFQHNSYRVERYARWFRGGYKFGRATVIAALAVAGVFDIPYFSVAAIVIMLWIAWKEFRTVYKKPIVYTMRVKRLFVTAAILTAAVIGAALVFIPVYAHAVALALLVMPIIMLAANLVNKPLEAAIARWYYNDAKRILRSMPNLTIIGVTGSFGKTSTKHYLYRILSERYNVLMTPGNFNTTLGVIRTVREHLKPHHQIFIVEMGAKQVGDIKEICDLVHPTIGVVTAVGEMHLETFGSVENVLRTKFELIDSLPADGLGVVNLDSEAIAAAKLTYPCRMVGYGVETEKAGYRAEQINYTPAQTTFSVKSGATLREEYSTHLAGRGNILNLLAAVAVADALQVPEALQKRAMRQIEQIEHRLSIKRTAGGITIIDDAYNSNPAGAKMALEVLRDFNTGGRKIVVTPGFVEMGDSQYRNNKALGVNIAAAADIAIVVNRVNRDAIVEGLGEAGFAAEKIIQTDSFAEASAYLASTMRAGDVILYENDLPDSFK